MQARAGRGGSLIVPAIVLLSVTLVVLCPHTATSAAAAAPSSVLRSALCSNPSKWVGFGQQVSVPHGRLEHRRLLGPLLQRRQHCNNARGSSLRNMGPWTVRGVEALSKSVDLASAAASTGESLKWDVEAFSPSKINLFLRIVGKRPDGFHDLGSLFQAISLGDTLKINKLGLEDEDTFECDMEGVPTDDSNLVVRAANLFRERAGVKGGLHMCLEKKVPAQGGLGGGSANAATTLWALNKIFDYPATQEQLVEWSAELGSDITFFLSSGTAYCSGRGEVLESVPQLPQRSVYIIKPEKGLSTPLVFKNLNYDALCKEDPRDILRRFYTDSGSNDKEKYINDLELPAFTLMPELQEIKDSLSKFSFEAVLMSGSGTSIFAIGEPGVAKDAFLQEIRTAGTKWGLEVFEAQFINRGEGLGDWYEVN
mmetsp:Transcript_112/g.258  ORF Transcript_112/g.258 Transcript_112/m.258 type:complete len:425 (-) Transcript_112:60-1334(-)